MMSQLGEQAKTLLQVTQLIICRVRMNQRGAHLWLGVHVKGCRRWARPEERLASNAGRAGLGSRAYQLLAVPAACLMSDACAAFDVSVSLPMHSRQSHEGQQESKAAKGSVGKLSDYGVSTLASNVCRAYHSLCPTNFQRMLCTLTLGLTLISVQVTRWDSAAAGEMAGSPGGQCPERCPETARRPWRCSRRSRR